MKDLIKNIRNSVNMNQEQLADCLGTTVLSVNRWENGKTETNKMAQKQLYQFCKDNNIALAEEIEVKYRREGKFFDEILGGK